MPKYSNSKGEMIEKSIIDRKTAKAKKIYKENFTDHNDYHFCERTGRVDLGWDCSHIISVKYAQETGRCELAWDLDNLELLSRGAHRALEDWPNKKREAWYFARKKGISFEDFIECYE